jgi:hypothetical protein
VLASLGTEEPKLEEARLMQNRDGVKKGPQDHAEGEHGAKTRSKILEQLHSKNGDGAVAPKKNGVEPATIPHPTAHRLFEERQQHDRAEKNSEKTRLNREVERRHLDPNHIPKS